MAVLRLHLSGNRADNFPDAGGGIATDAPREPENDLQQALLREALENQDFGASAS
jgi:hypothetical protein